MRIERVGLEDDADIAVARLDLVDDMTVEQEFPAARNIDAREHEQARRLAAAGGSEKRDELAVLYDEVHVGDHLDVAEALRNVAEFDLGHLRQPFTPPIDICMR